MAGDLHSESFLSHIHTPGDLRALPKESIPDLCREIRETLVATVTENGGHLASNLGVVELSVAMHRVFDCPRDHFIFDVGHQSYVHKLLTGRYGEFHTLRRGGGLSGFTKRSGRCLVGAVQKDGVLLISVTLSAPNDWNDHKTLWNYGFSLLGLSREA